MKVIDYHDMDMDFIQLGFQVRVRGSFRFDGKRLRSALGPATRRVSCEYPDVQCKECKMRAKCLYALMYEPGTVASGKGPVTPPPPFVLRRLAWDGHEAGVEYVLFGPAMEYATMFGVATVDAIRSIDPSAVVRPGIREWMGHAEKLFSKQSLDAYLDKRIKELENTPIRARFLTPLRLKRSGMPISEITGEYMARAIARRVRLLLGFYGHDQANVGLIGGILQPPNQFDAQKIHSFLRWVEDVRYSARQRRRVPAGGVKGYIDFEGLDKKGLGLLALAELFNMGSMTTMGYGAIELTGGKE